MVRSWSQRTRTRAETGARSPLHRSRRTCDPRREGRVSIRLRIGMSFARRLSSWPQPACVTTSLRLASVCQRQIVSKWRKRFFYQRLAGMDEEPRGGREVRFSPQLRRLGQTPRVRKADLTARSLAARLPTPLVANVCTTPATGTAEREAAELLLDASAPPGSTVGGDKNFDVRALWPRCDGSRLLRMWRRRPSVPPLTAARRVTRDMPSANRNGS
jgi:hypothetical protein